MTTRIISNRTWEGDRDENSHRTYKLKIRVQGDTSDGPANALQTPGLPVFGAVWVFGQEVDVYAWCRYNVEGPKPVHKEGDPVTLWDLTYTFSTKPPERNSRTCKDVETQDPLLEPQKVNGAGVKYTEEAVYDMFNNPVQNSAHEIIRGKENEWDHNRGQVTIVQNVADLQQELCENARDTVNDQPLWGLPPRCVKLSEFKWARKYWKSCFVYFERTFTFDCRRDSFDRTILDEGTKVLSGHWGMDGSGQPTGLWIDDNINGQAPDPTNPLHFIRATDFYGNPMKVILDGNGRPADSTVGGNVVCIRAALNNPLSSRAHWRQVVGTVDPVQWQNSKVYMPSQLIQGDDGNFYIAGTKNRGLDPTTAPGSAVWRLLGGSLNNKGLYSAQVQYNPGDYVQTIRFGNEGQRFVQKYPESNMLLLNIPTDFTVLG